MELGIQIGGVLLALMFLVFLILGRKSWKWFHMFAMFLVMAATIAFCIYAALADKTRRAWAERYQKEKTKVEELDLEGFQLEHGDPTQRRLDPGLTQLRGALWRATHGRSHVYRNCTVAGFDGSSPVVVTIPAPPAVELPTLAGETAPPPAAPPKIHSIPLNSTVYAFIERSRPVPDNVEYLGEFYVTAATESSVTLRPSLPPLPPYTADGASRWTLYEEIPADRQNYVNDLRDPDVLNALFPGGDLNLDEAVAVQENKRILELLFPAARMGLAPDSQEYKDFIDRFRFDGWPLNKINTARAAEGSPEFDPPQYEMWARIEFLTPEKFDVDSTASDAVSGDAGADATVPEVFDSEGRAVASELRQGSQTEIDLDVEELREGVFDNVPIEAPGVGDTERVGTTDALVAAGKAKVLEKVYVRKLNDFRHHFRQIYDNTILRRSEIDELVRELMRIGGEERTLDSLALVQFNSKFAALGNAQQAQVRAALEQVMGSKTFALGATEIIVEQEEIRKAELAKLSEDRTNYEAQLKAAEAYAKDLSEKLAAKKANIDKLIADISTYETRLAIANRKMEDAVRRNAQAVSAGTTQP